MKKAKGIYISPGPAGPTKCTVGIEVSDDTKRGDMAYGPCGQFRITSFTRQENCKDQNKQYKRG